MRAGNLTITIADVCMVIIAVFVVLAYFHGWG
jgi:hypothetical protein